MRLSQTTALLLAALLLLVAAPADLLASPGGLAPTAGPPATRPAPGTARLADVTFTTPGNQSYTVPTTGPLTLAVRGADGGNRSSRAGGSGAEVTATFAAQAGDVLTVVVGGLGAAGVSSGGESSGGTGGGGSAVILTRGGTPTLLLAAGAGGGGGLTAGGGGNSANGTATGGQGAVGESGGGGGFNAPGQPVGANNSGEGGLAGTLSGGANGGYFGLLGGFGFGGGGAGDGGTMAMGGGGGGGYGGGNFGGTLSGGAGGSSFVQSTGIAGTAITRTNGAAGGGLARNGRVVATGPATAVRQAALFNPSAAQDDGAGYRLLGAPVTGYTVTDLAALNLVQGVPAGANAATHPAQYPLAGANLQTGYTGNGAYTRPDADDVLTPGRGFFWHLYDRTIAASGGFGGGTSSSRELTGFALSAAGPSPTANVAVTFADNAGADNFQMLANPFARPLAVSGITASGGALQGGVVQAYNPNGQTFVLRMGADRLAVWQGVFAELVPAAPGGAVTVTYAYGSTDTGAAPPFYGRGGAGPPEAAARPSVRFALAGVLAGGTAVADSAAVVRFDPAATAGWDVLDASKLTPPVAAYALLAPAALRDGAPTRLAVDTRADGPVAVVPLAFSATDAGTFTLSWTTELPAGWSATLTDAWTGETVDLASASEMAFTTDAAQDWAERFTLAVRPAGAMSGETDPAVTSLSLPVPNPATRRAALSLSLGAPQHVRATVVDALGREVLVVLDGEASGAVRLDVDASRLAPGVYVVRVRAAAFAETRRLTVVR